MRGSSDAAGGRGAEESETAEEERLRAEDFLRGTARDEQRRDDEQQQRRDEYDCRHQHREQNRADQEKNDDAVIHQVSVG